VTELFEARTPSNPAIISEINGEVLMDKVKRGKRIIRVKNRSGVEKSYEVPTTKQILVQENDYVRAGTRLSDGGISPTDILNILGPVKAQEYIVNEIQAVYRLQGVKINDKHFEIIVRQMMRKVQIGDPGDTEYLPEELVDKWEFMDANDAIFGKYYVLDPGDSVRFEEGDIIGARDMRSENASLERQGMKPMVVRDARPATASQILQGITRAGPQDRLLHLRRLLPGDHEGAQRSRDPRPRGPSRGSEGERHLRSPHPGRYRSVGLPGHRRGLQDRLRRGHERPLVVLPHTMLLNRPFQYGRFFVYLCVKYQIYHENIVQNHRLGGDSLLGVYGLHQA
jgi:RNA polymerase Rpb1, domain 5.